MIVKSPDKVRPLRADGLRNRAALVEHAVDLVAEYGPDVPLDDIARAAGVGSATLYRHFPDRAALLSAVAERVVTETADAAERALAEEPDSFAALARYVEAALRVRVAWVMPHLGPRLPAADRTLVATRQRSVAAITKLIANAQRDGAVRADLTFGDLGQLLIRLSRPMPPGADRATQETLTARHAAIMLAGLRPDGAPLPGRGLELADLRRSRKRTR